MWLACSNSCGGLLFRALFAEIEIDSGGAYIDHRIVQDAYVCLNCGSVAMDLGQVPEAMAAVEAEDDPLPAELMDVLCPVCETPVSVVPGEDCPSCGAALELVL